MGTKYKNVGGSGTGLGQDFSQFLLNGLNTGTFGAGTAGAQYGAANPVGQTQGIAGVLNSILSPGAGALGGSLNQLLQLQQQNDVNDIRSRFGVGGGTAFGTPGQYAESTYRAQAAPQIATQIGQLQLGALGQILPYIGQFGMKDIPQAEVAAQENPWLTAAKFGLGVGSTALGFGINPFGGGGGGGGGWGTGFGGQPGITPPGAMSFSAPNSLNLTGGGYYNPMIAGGYSPSFQLRH